MSALNFNDSQTRNAEAAASLAERDAEKRRASMKDPDVDPEYQQKSDGKRWVGENVFDQRSGGRTTTTT
jgi:hypothetical protein